MMEWISQMFVVVMGAVVLLALGPVSSRLWKGRRRVRAQEKAEALFAKDLGRIRADETLSDLEKSAYITAFERSGFQSPRYQHIIQKEASSELGLFISFLALVYIGLVSGQFNQDLGISYSALFIRGVVSVVVMLQVLHAVEWCMHRYVKKEEEEREHRLEHISTVDFRYLFSENEWEWAVRFAKRRGIASFEEERQSLVAPTFTKTGADLLHWVQIKEKWEAFVSERQPTAEWFDKDLTIPTPLLNVELTEEESSLYEARKGFEREMERHLRMAPYVYKRGDNIYAV